LACFRSADLVSAMALALGLRPLLAASTVYRP
jgi:hypothetical protein